MTELVQQQRMPASDARSEERPRRERSISEPRGSTNKTIVRKYPVERQEKCLCGWREIPAGTKVEVMADTTGRAGPAAVCLPAGVVLYGVGVHGPSRAGPAKRARG